jgi:hypothetical protein
MADVATNWTYTRTGTVQATDPRDGTVAANVPPKKRMLLTSCSTIEGVPDPLGAASTRDGIYYLGYTDGKYWAYSPGSGAGALFFSSDDLVTWTQAFTAATVSIGFVSSCFLGPNDCIYVYESTPRLHRIANPASTRDTTTVIYDAADGSSPAFTVTAEGSGNEGAMVIGWSMAFNGDGSRVAVVEYNKTTTRNYGGWKVFWSTDGGESFDVLFDWGDEDDRDSLGYANYTKHIHTVRYNGKLGRWTAFAGDAAQATVLSWDDSDNPTLRVDSPYSVTAIQPVDGLPLGNGLVFGDDSYSTVGYWDGSDGLANHLRCNPLWAELFPLSAATFTWAVGSGNGLFVTLTNNDVPAGTQIYRDTECIALQPALGDRYRPPAALIGRMRADNGISPYYFRNKGGKWYWSTAVETKDESSGDTDFTAWGYNGRPWIEQDPVDWTVQDGVAIDTHENFTLEGVSDGSVSLSSPWGQSAAGEGIEGGSSTCLTVTIPAESTSLSTTLKSITSETWADGDAGTLVLWVRSSHNTNLLLGATDSAASPALWSSGIYNVGSKWRRIHIPFVANTTTLAAGLRVQLVLGSAAALPTPPNIPAQTWPDDVTIYIDKVCVTKTPGGWFDGEAATKATPSYTTLFSAGTAWTDVFEIEPDFSSHRNIPGDVVVREYVNGGSDYIKVLYRRENVDFTVLTAVGSGSETTITAAPGTFTDDMVGSMCYLTNGGSRSPFTVKSITDSETAVLGSDRGDGLTGSARVLKSVWVCEVDFASGGGPYYGYAPARQVFPMTAGYKFAVSNGLSGVDVFHYSGEGWVEFEQGVVYGGAVTELQNTTIGVYAGGANGSVMAPHVVYNWGTVDSQLNAAGLTAQIQTWLDGLTASPADNSRELRGLDGSGSILL